MDIRVQQFVSTCVRNRAGREIKRKNKQAVGQDWWDALDEARSYLSKVILRQISSQARLMEALARVTSETGTTLSLEVLEALEKMNPGEAADLMTVCCYVRTSNKDKTQVEPEKVDDLDYEDED